MPKFESRESTHSDNFYLKATVGSLDQFEKAMAIAFNERRSTWYAETKEFGLIFFEYLTDKEKRDLHRPVEYPLSVAPAEDIKYESYIIRQLPSMMSVGPAVEFALEWMKTMSQDKFETFAGPPAFQWDVWSDVGVLVSTGTEWNQMIGSHSGGICHVKPRWMYNGR